MFCFCLCVLKLYYSLPQSWLYNLWHPVQNEKTDSLVQVAEKKPFSPLFPWSFFKPIMDFFICYLISLSPGLLAGQTWASSSVVTVTRCVRCAYPQTLPTWENGSRMWLSGCKGGASPEPIRGRQGGGGWLQAPGPTVPSDCTHCVSSLGLSQQEPLPSGLDDRNLMSHVLQESVPDQGVGRAGSSWGLWGNLPLPLPWLLWSQRRPLTYRRWTPFPPCSFCTCLPLCPIFPLYKDTSYAGSGPPSFQRDLILTPPFTSALALYPSKGTFWGCYGFNIYIWGEVQLNP